MYFEENTSVMFLKKILFFVIKLLLTLISLAFVLVPTWILVAVIYFPKLNFWEGFAVVCLWLIVCGQFQKNWILIWFSALPKFWES